MKSSTAVWIAVIVIVLLAGWYLWATSSAPGVPSTGTPAATSTAPGTAMQAIATSSDPSVGTYLVASNGMTLYTFGNDTAGTSTCYGQCAQLWPPYAVAAGTIVGEQGGISGITSTIQRKDGSLQVTYNGMPLYTYAQDSAPGQVNGNGVNGLWHVAKP